MARNYERDNDDTSTDGSSVSGGLFNLHIEHPWKNPFGMLVIKGTEVEEENTVIDKLTIMKPIFDVNDFEEKRYKGRLCSDGGGIIATEPTIPGYLLLDPKAIQLLVDDKHMIDNVCQPTFRTYKTIRTEMKKDASTRKKEVVYRFPPGVTCNNEFFNTTNRRSSQLELDTQLVMAQQLVGEDEEDNPIMNYCPFIVWRVSIDGLAKQTADEEDDGVSAAQKAFAKFGIKKKGTKKGGGSMDTNS